MRATVLIELRAGDGEVVERRFARNSVMRTGADLDGGAAG